MFDVPKNEIKEVVELIKDKMEHPWKLVVPIKVSVKVGPNWLDMEEIK